MTAALLIGFCLCSPTDDVPRIPPDLPKELEVWRQQLLKSLRRDRAALEDTLKMYERHAELFETRGKWPEGAKRNRQYARETREELKQIDRLERELWEQQPGGITAPPPRPKGTPLRPAPVRD